MKTEWRSCNRETQHIWFNVELAKKHPDSLVYFTNLVDSFLPD